METFNGAYMKNNLLRALAIISLIFIHGCVDNSADPANSEPKIIISKVELIKDNNMDGKINPGEGVKFALRLKNIGSQTARGVKVIHIRWLKGKDTDNYEASDYDYGDLAPGSESDPMSDTKDYSILVRLERDAVPGDLYRFEVLMQGDTYRQWRDTISFVVEKSGAIMEVSRIEIYKDPNENGKANPGEFVSFNAYIKNIGTSGGNVYLRKLEQIKYGGVLKLLEYYSGPEQYVPAGLECKDGFTFDVDIEESVLPGSTLKYRLELANYVGDSWYDTVAVQIERSDVDIKFSKVEIWNDEDNKLERASFEGIKVCLKNVGKDIARDVSIISVITSPHVLVSSNHDQSLHGNIMPGQEDCGQNSQYYGFDIFIELDDPVKDKLKVNLVLKDGEGNRWEESFELDVEQ